MPRWLANPIAAVKSTKGYGYIRKVRGAIKTKLNWLYSSYRRSRSRATFIAVTGSSAKTTSVALLSHILSVTAKTKTQVESNSFGPTWDTLADLQDAKYVVMELGTNTPGDVPKMAAVVRPNIAIITMVGLEHYSAFRSKEAVAKEKASLVAALPVDGLAILNRDDPNVLAMAQQTKARVVTFGMPGADYSYHDVSLAGPAILAFTLTFRDRRIRLQTQLTGAHNTLAVSAAVACALEMGVPETTIVERVASFKPVFTRLSVHPMKNGPTFILDTKKAPYESLPLCLQVLASCEAPRKRFVLGQISDFRGNPAAKYRDTYRDALKIADAVVFVGENAKRSKATEAEIEQGRFAGFADVGEASRYIKATAVPGEIILVKGSKNLHLERLMLDWQADVQCWPNACGVAGHCLDCGLYSIPFADHGGKGSKLPRKVRGK
jgi:UDP-N-acetylmuramoyl-tripeptide--D-alanyl-D-alanine ligase